jgi:hypothetical protein
MNEVAQHFLETYARGGEVDGGWKFAKALQQTRLDYSEQSLGRLDKLLAAIRERAKPSSEALRETLPGRNFCSLIAYYVIEVVRRRSGASIDWHDRAGALRALPPGTQLPDAPFARLIANAFDQGAAFMPLGWVESQVLGDGGPAIEAGEYVAGLVAQIERDGPVVWWTGMHAVGKIASWQMMMAADGGAVLPTSLSSTAPTTWVMPMTGLPGSDIDSALEMAGRSLEENPQGATWQVLAYDGIAEFENGRFDAVMVLLYTYGKSPLRLKMAFPYRPPQDGRAFTILDPRLREANVANDKVAMLNGAMERGIQSIKWAFGKTWDQLREAQEAAPTPRNTPVLTAEQAWANGAHYVAPLPLQPEMERAISKLRDSFVQTQKRFTPSMLTSVAALAPHWLQATDALSEILKQQTLLLTEGTIVWGALVQANKLLFAPGDVDCPALLVHSNDAYFDVRPQELRLIGHKIFGLKETKPSDPALAAVAQLVSDEMDRSMGFKLPPVFSNKDMRAAAFMVFRKHIPNGVLSAGLFPLLTHPSTDAVMIVPFEFWPIDMVIMWKEGKL